ncbi:MAG: ankyrin repeat domain-containing protein [Acidobacteriota bacterium]
MEITADSARGQELKRVIAGGEVEALRAMLDAEPALARARVAGPGRERRTLLHVATDWPGHFPRGRRRLRRCWSGGWTRRRRSRAATRRSGRCTGRRAATTWRRLMGLAIDALLVGGAARESPGAIFTNGTAMSDAVIFAQWAAARRLLERGAQTTFTEAAGLGEMDRLRARWAEDPAPGVEMLTAALWHACRGGQEEAARFLVERGANLNRVGWDGITPLDGAVQSGNRELVAWLLGQGARHGRGGRS